MGFSKITFILDHALKKYRLPFFRQLADKNYKITVIHPGKEISGLSFIEQKKSKLQMKFKGLEYRNISFIEKESVVIYMQNLRIINFWLMTLNPWRGNKLIH